MVSAFRWFFVIRPREQRRAGDGEGEGQNPENGSRAEPLAEERRPGRNRERVREERRHPRRRQRTSALESQLQRGEGEPVAGEQHGHEREPAASRYRGLGGYVAGRVENPGGEAEARAAPAADQGGCAGRGGGGRDPGGDGRPRAARAMAGLPGQRGREQAEPGDRDGDSAALPRGQPRVARDQQREQADASGRGRLHERERRQRQRSHVEPPAPQSDEEAREPPPLAEEQAQRCPRPAQRQRWQRRSGSMLREVPPVQRARRGKREREPGQEARGQRPLRPAKGRYASAASAAIPTRGRSSRRS